MKKLFPIIMVLLTAMAIGGVILYSVRQNLATGGEAPEIHFDQEQIDLETTSGESEMLRGVTATDKEDGDVTDSLLVENVSRFVDEDTVEVTYVAYDSQNHVSRAGRRVHFTDYTHPRFTFGAPMIFMSKNVNDMLNKVGAKDAMDGNISVKVHASFDDDSSTLATVGVHNVEFSVTNSLGDTARILVPVRVVEDVTHTELLPLKSYLVYLSRGAAFDAKSYLTNAEQAESVDKHGRNESYVEIKSTVDVSKSGVYAVDYNLIKNDTTTATTRLIVVVD